jgi:hypothetical protein
MSTEYDILRRATCMVPLIRSITTEAHERRRAIRQLENRLKGTSPRRPRADVLEHRQLECELFTHRRQMECVQKELARLGCRMDASCPGRIVWQLKGHEVLFEGRLDHPRVNQNQFG